MRTLGVAVVVSLTLALSTAHAGTIVTGLGAGGTPQVGIFNSATTTQLSSFLAFDSAFTGGVRVAVGDVNIAGAGPAGGPHVKVLDGATAGADIVVGADAGGGRRPTTNDQRLPCHR
jgi:hypothetical protein